MKIIDDLHKIIDTCVKYKLTEKQTIFSSKTDFTEWLVFFKVLGENGITYGDEPKLEPCDFMVIYGGFTLHFINIDK
jgi:hypothetical protein